MIVNHAHPIHDGFCRCRTCKPSPVGQRSTSLTRIRLGTAGIAAVAIALIAARVAGVVS